MKIALQPVVVISSLVVALTQTAPAHAGLITALSGLNGLGNYNGTVNYVPVDATHGTLNITLNNTSPADNGGYLTAFAFNNPGRRITGATLWSGDGHFHLLGAPSFNDGVNGAPFGGFDLGASTGNSFEGGGNPTNGIAVGHSDDFVFHLTGDGLNTLTTDDFFTAYSVPPGDGEGAQSLVARFRGFENGGSDKVPGIDPPLATPEPATLLMSSTGLAVLLALCYRRRGCRRPDPA
jgi:hypothetical protein